MGRLDRETTGLLLFTTDGELANAVLRPDHQTTKIYWLWLDEALSDDDPRLAQLTQGVSHHGQLLTARSAAICARTEYATELELTLTQGRKRQIRNACHALGLPLVHLHRKRIGPLTDTGLAIGAWRELEAAEVEALWTAVGGRAALYSSKLESLRELGRAARAAGSPELRLERWLATQSVGSALPIA